MSIDDGSLDQRDRTLYIVEMPNGNWHTITRVRAEAFTVLGAIRKTCSFSKDEPKLITVWIPPAMPAVPEMDVVAHLRDPAEYLLIRQIIDGKDHQGDVLMRLAPGLPVPDGWELVEKRFGKSVYREGGKLDYKYMALERYGTWRRPSN